jgi:hypothetical protein
MDFDEAHIPGQVPDQVSPTWFLQLLQRRPLIDD